MGNIFDILGPVMVGPSSSHTAGAVRIGMVARQLFGRQPEKAEVILHGSFAATGKGHGTDRALIAGLLVMMPDDMRIPDSYEVAKDMGMDFVMKNKNIKGAHPNTAQIIMEAEGVPQMKIQAHSIGGGRICVCKLDGIDVNFSGESCTLIIRNVDEIVSYDPTVYETLIPQNIARLIVSPIYRDREVIGFYGIDNPPLDRMDHIAFMLQLLGHFINSMLRRRDLVGKLETLSYHDQLTGAKNRHAMNEKLASLANGGSLGIIYSDVMGLKQINDDFGHQAGDEALIYACENLKAHFPDKCVYRIGGDEFLVLIPGITENLFQSMIRSMLVDMAKSSVHLALGSVWVDDCTGKVEKSLSEADARMYEDKRAYYAKNRQLDRRRH